MPIGILHLTCRTEPEPISFEMQQAVRMAPGAFAEAEFVFISILVVIFPMIFTQLVPVKLHILFVIFPVLVLVRLPILPLAFG